MKKYLTLFVTAFLSFSLFAIDAEARRLGGGKSIGKQRESIGQQVSPKPPAQAPTAAPASAGGSRWLGPLAGLAAGGLLAALFFGGAFDGIRFLDVMMIALLIAAAFFVLRMLRQKAAPRTAPLRYAGLDPNRATQNSGHNTGRAEQPVLGSGVAETRAYPPGFDPVPFLRSAKTSFIRLQAANDARDLNDLRDYTTPEMYAELAMQMEERGDVRQKTEVVRLDADMLDVANEDERAIASVRFSGLIRETDSGPTEPFDEIWHVQKDLRDPKSVWLIAGIQQVTA